MSHEPSQYAEDWRKRLTFGTYRKSGEALATQLQQAVAAGFTRFDTAQMYRNERTVGAVLRSAFGPDCSDMEHKLHITTKVSRHEYPHVAAARLRRSADALGFSGKHLNRVLLHRPMPCDQYRLLEDLLPRNGAPRSDNDDANAQNTIVDEIGVSNYTKADLLTLMAVARVKPCVNQVEFHPFVPGARQLLSFCNEHGIPLQAHTVLAQAKFMAYPPLVAMARRKQATPAQILLRFALDNGVDAVVSSSCPDHLAELVAAASNLNWRLDPLELAEMFTWSIAATGAPHRFYNRYGRVPPVAHVSTSTDIEQYVAQVADALLADLRLTDKAGNIVETSMDAFSNTLQSIPTGFSANAITQDPISLQIATRMFPESRDPLTCYRQALKTLRAASLMKEKSVKESGRGQTCSLRSRQNHPQRVEGTLADKDFLNQTAIEVLEPVAMPVTVSSRNELEPILQFIESSETGHLFSPGAQFIRGTLFADGRMEYVYIGCR
jgi:diketogulonate reductase-like aldo/keto reductase